MVRLAGMAVAAAALMAAVPGAAATTLNLNSGGTTTAGGKNWTVGGVNVHVTAWALIGSSPVAATLGQWAEGLGVSYGSNDAHTVDNASNGEFILLQFDRAVTLRTAAFNTGWFGWNDTDASISYAAVNYAAAGTNYNSTGTAFWNAAGTQLATNLYGAGSIGSSGDSTRNINAGAKSGNTWLIASSFANPDALTDSFKLKAVSFDVAAPVPEPATWATMILGMGGIGGIMRRKAAARARVRTRLAFA